MDSAPAGAPLAPSGEAQENGEQERRAAAPGSPTSHLGSADAGAAVVVASTPPTPPSFTDSGEHMHPAESKLSMDSEDSELGKDGSNAGSVADSSGSRGSGPSPHYDAKQDVILRLEFLRAKEIKVWRGVWSGWLRRSGTFPLVDLPSTPAYRGRLPNLVAPIVLAI